MKRGSIAINQTFWIVLFLITIVVFIASAVWLKGYGLGIIKMLPGLAGAFYMEKGIKKKGLSITLNAIWFLVAIIFILMVLAVMDKIGLLAIA
jgi:hypothetical protein